MAAEDTSKTNITILKGESNFSIWKFQIKLVLENLDIFDIVDGTTVKPEDNQVSYSLWIKKDKKAQQVIGTTVDGSLVKHIMYCTSSKSMWDKLHEIFQQKTQISKHLLLQSFFNCVKQSDDSIADHIAKLVNLTERLSSLGEKISDTMLITKILMSLPSEYKHFHAAWDSTESSEQTVENLRSRLMTEEARISLEDCAISLDEENYALVSKKKMTDANKRCNYCKELGHWKDSCEKLKNKGVSNKQWSFVCSSSKLQKDVWYSDSAVTEHMTPFLGCLRNFVELDEPICITVGNNQQIFGYGYGNVHFVAFVNGVWRNATIDRVLYVPELVCSLFSTNIATKGGAIQVFDDQGFVLIKDNEVVLQGKKDQDLYSMDFKVLFN